MHPQSDGPGDSWAFCLSFALQLALVLPVSVGSLLTYGSHPSRWGHPCGVEASLSLIGTKVLCISFPFGLCLHVVTALRDGHHMGQVLVWRAGRWSWVLRPFSWLGFEPLSEASLRALSYRWVSWWSSRRPRVFGCP